MNSRFYGFAIRCIGPLCHLCLKSILKHTNYLGMYSSSLNRYDPIFNVFQYALHPPAVIIEYQDMTLSYPSHTPSTRFPTGTVLVLPTLVRLDQNRPYLSQYFSSCGTTLSGDTRNVRYKYSLKLQHCIK